MCICELVTLAIAAERHSSGRKSNRSKQSSDQAQRQDMRSTMECQPHELSIRDMTLDLRFSYVPVTGVLLFATICGPCLKAGTCAF